jgi:hypothetical protein
MDGQDIWFSYWYFHLPNYALSVLFYTLWGRFLLGAILRPDTKNYIYRWFCRLTDWLIRPVAFITPSIIPPMLVIAVASFWVVVLRIAFFAAMYAAGLTPRLAQAAG